MMRVTVAAAACLAVFMSAVGPALAQDKPGPHKTFASMWLSQGADESDDSDENDTAGLPYTSLISKYARQYGVPVSLAHAVVRVESNFNPNARGSAGEIGLMQIKPATARLMGYRGGNKGLFDPETNIRFGMKYLAAAHELGGGETCGTILRYNAGHAATRMNPISKRYCGKVLALMD